MDKTRLTFTKEERLRTSGDIAHLFEEGRSIFFFPCKILWISSETIHPFPAQAAFSVSKKIFRNAVDRNLLKRRMREAYRTNKNSFYFDLGGKKITLMFIFIAHEKLPYHIIEKAIQAGLKKIVHQSNRDKRKDLPMNSQS
jgi:ribonuclease P protein component